MLHSGRFTWGPVVKHIAAIAVVGLLCSLAAQAQTCLVEGTICIDNGGGTATSGTGSKFDGLTLTSAPVTLVSGFGGSYLAGKDLGTISFTTGRLLTGSLGAGCPANSLCGTFGAGTITITLTTPYNGFTGTLFQGTFGTPTDCAQHCTPGISWIYTGKSSGGYYDYELTGPVAATFENGIQVTGSSNQTFFFKSKTPFHGGSITLSNGKSTLVTPEPAALGLMGTGLFGVGFIVRRKARAEAKLRALLQGSKAQSASAGRVSASPAETWQTVQPQPWSIVGALRMSRAVS